MLKIAVFVSGRGSNLISIFEKIKEKSINAEISFVVSSNSSAKAIDFCINNSIDYACVSSVPKDGYILYQKVLDKLIEKNIGLIVLAGFMKKIPELLVDNFENKIINIHPALLPSFGGKGMYGIKVHEAVFESSAKVSGATVHFVNSNYDDGKIIAQRCVDISSVEDSQAIADKVLKVEHELLPFVVQMFAENKLKEKNNRIFINS